MRTYDNPEFRSYHMGLVDIGAGTAPNSIPVPAGAEGARIVGISISGLTEAFTADTTGGGIQIGTASDPNKFCDSVLPVIALTDSHDATDGVLDAGKEIKLGYDGDAGAALTQLEVDYVAPTGGTPGGIGLVEITKGWY